MNRTLTKSEEERYARAADWAECVDGIPAEAAVIDATIPQDGRTLMADLLGSPEAVERAMGRSVDGEAS